MGGGGVFRITFAGISLGSVCIFSFIFTYASAVFCGGCTCTMLQSSYDWVANHVALGRRATQSHKIMDQPNLEFCPAPAGMRPKDNVRDRGTLVYFATFAIEECLFCTGTFFRKMCLRCFPTPPLRHNLPHRKEIEQFHKQCLLINGISI